MPEDIYIKLVRKYLKLKILSDDVTWRGSPHIRRRVSDLIRSTVERGEAHSALIIGPRGCGKTTLISSVLSELESDLCLCEDAVVVRLNGLLHHDDKLALQAITTQMQLENAVGDRVFGTVSENLSFLLSCLSAGDKASRSMLFLLEEFHAFCRPGLGQTLLYNLFDLTHAATSPMCVLGVTSRLDVMELLEKRVKSRFSHNHIFIFPNEPEPNSTVPQTPCEYFINLFIELLSLPDFSAKTKKNKHSKKRKEKDTEVSCTKYGLPERVLEKCRVDPKEFETLDKDFVSEWNAHIKAMSEDETVVDSIEKFAYYSNNEQIFRDMLLQLVSTSLWDHTSVATAIDNAVSPELRTRHLQSLSILELSLLIAMEHGMEVLDGQPMNFEMVLHRYTKFANANSSAQTVPRAVTLKAFEHLQALELISPVRSTDGNTSGVSRVQKEYQLYTMTVSRRDLNEAASGFKALPTEIMHWLNNSVV